MLLFVVIKPITKKPDYNIDKHMYIYKATSFTILMALTFLRSL